MYARPQQDHADLGIVDDDHTEDMRKAPAATEALQNTHPHKEAGSSIMAQDNPYPVNSTYYRCCNSIGRHAPTCTALTLDKAVNLAVLAHTDITAVMQALPADSSIWAHVDLARALGHLRQAAALIDKAADTLTADAAVVAR